MKSVWIVVVLAAAGVGGWLYYSKQQTTATASAASAELQRPTTAKVESRNIRFTVSAAGEITPAEQVSVRPEINGRIATLLVDIGDTVKKGSVFFTLDDRDLQIEKETQEKEIERTKVQLAQAERNYLRSKQLYEEKLVATEVHEQSRTDYDLAKNSLSKAEKALELMQDKMRKTRILAPFDCTVLTRPVSVGQSVSGSAGFNSGTEVITIADLNQLIINAHINQADITRLRVNQEVEVTVEAISGLKVMGTVERIAPQAAIKNNIKGFAARILLKDVDPRIRPSMTANIKIPVSSADNVLSVPLASVFTELNPASQLMERFVYVKNDAGYERRLVQLGVSDYFFAEIQTGVADGELVSLEEPKEEVEKRNRAKSVAAFGGGDSKPATSKAPAMGNVSTNSPKAGAPVSKAAATGS
ncbi:MAG: efflux RND transporter periplasmic adaptor subunit [Verrucomicrobia bacterium]|nr:efflux RND transporter periplasmic adaptor subunit [Verrucomicrobiota bacterium]